MAAISTSIQLADQMTPALRAISTSMNIVINTFESMQAASERSIDIVALQTARDKLAGVNVAVQQIEDSVKESDKAQERFNETVSAGGTAYDSLVGKVGCLAATLGIGVAIKKAAAMTYESAAQLEATEAKYNTVFAGMTNSADQFISDFQTLTPATVAEARSMASGMQDLLVPMGLQRSAATEMTGDYMHLIGALTNFNSATRTAEDVAGAFQSALSGEYDSLKGLGIQVNETIVKQQAVSMGLASSTDAVTNAAKAQAVLQLAYQQSGDALAAYNEQSLDTTTRMQLLQKGFQDAFAQAGQTVLPQVNGLLQQMQARMPDINAGIQAFAGVLSEVASAAGDAFGIIMDVGGVIADNWSWLAPVIGGATAAMIAYNAVMVTYNTIQTISSGLNAISAARAALKAGADLAGAAAAKTATGAQVGLNAALLACPLTWIIIAIVAVVAAIAVWIHHVGGIKVAWLMCVNAVLTAADNLKLGFMFIWTNIQNGIDNMQYGFAVFKTAVLDTLGRLKVMGLTILESFINGAIDQINKLIGLANSIPGVAIETISYVEFAADAAAVEETKRQQRASDLATMRDQNAADKKAREQEYNRMVMAANAAQIHRKAEITAAQSDAARKKAVESNQNSAVEGQDDVVNNTAETANNTAKMGDSMNMAEENLKYMRDLAEQETINRFTTAEIKVDMVNNNSVSSGMDLDGIVSYLVAGVQTSMEQAAEGVHA